RRPPAHTRYAIRSPHTCSTPGPTSVACRNCSGTRASARRSYTPTSALSDCETATRRPTPAPDAVRWSGCYVVRLLFHPPGHPTTQPPNHLTTQPPIHPTGADAMIHPNRAGTLQFAAMLLVGLAAAGNAKAEGLNWQPSYGDALREAARTGKPIMLVVGT